MFDALEGHNGSVRILGLRITNFQFAEDIIISADVDEEADAF